MLDGRAWELVSPPDKGGALIEPFVEGDIQAAADGSGIAYVTNQPVAEGPRGNTAYSQILSRVRALVVGPRKIISTPYVLPKGEPAISLFDASSGDELFSPNLSLAVIEPDISSPSFSLSSEAPERTDYLRDNSNGTYTPLVNDKNVPPGTQFGGKEIGNGGSEMTFWGATPDLSHIILSAPQALTPKLKRQNVKLTNCSIPANLFEWSAGRLQLVSILPNGESAYIASLAPDDEGATQHAVSSDGRRIAWTIEEGVSTFGTWSKKGL